MVKNELFKARLVKRSARTGGGPAPKAPAAATAKIIDLFKDTLSFKVSKACQGLRPI